MTTTDLKELIAQRHAIDIKINEMHKAQKDKALADVKATISEHGLTQADIFGTGRKPQRQNGKPKVPAIFRNPETGVGWSGRGLPPKWIAGKDREAFRIPEEDGQVPSTDAA